MALSAVRQLQDEELDIVGGLAGTVTVSETINYNWSNGYVCPPVGNCTTYSYVDSVTVSQTTTTD
jgi:hypothetical protein